MLAEPVGVETEVVRTEQTDQVAAQGGGDDGASVLRVQTRLLDMYRNQPGGPNADQLAQLTCTPRFAWKPTYASLLILCSLNIYFLDSRLTLDVLEGEPTC